MKVALLALVIVLIFSQAAISAAYRQIMTENISSLKEDFTGLKDWSMPKGKAVVKEEQGEKFVLAEGELRLELDKQLPAPYCVRTRVRLAPKGKIHLTADRNEKGGYQIQISEAREKIHVRVLANGSDLWDRNTYKYRESPEASPVYCLRIDTNSLNWKISAMEKVLAGNKAQRTEWGLGIKGELYEQKELAGLKALAAENQAQPLAEQYWVDMSIIVSKDQVSFWVDGRMVGEVKDPVIMSKGVEINMSSLCRLKNLDIASLPSSAARFVPLDLAGYYNSRVERLSGKVPRGWIEADGIPFFLGENAYGRDNIDVGKSAPLESGLEWAGLGCIFTHASGMLRNPYRTVLRIPKGWYDELYLVGYSDEEAETEPVVSFRFFNGTITDYSAKVPYWSETKVQNAVPIKLGETGGKKNFSLWLVKIPLSPCLLQSYLEYDYYRYLEVEVTRGLHFTRYYPDPAMYDSVSGGKKSSVHILGLTLRESPLEMVVATDEVGHIVAEPEKPYLNVLLRNRSEKARTVLLSVEARNMYEEVIKLENEFRIEPGAGLEKRCLLPLKKYGLYTLKVTAKSEGVILIKDTSLGYLAPDTRKANWGSSLFGIWSWGAGVSPGAYNYPPNSEDTLRLIWKLGARWAHGLADSDIVKKYGITAAYSMLPVINFDKVPKENWEKELKENMIAGLKMRKADYPDQDLYLLFGEQNLGIRQTYALPGKYYGEPEYKLNEEEQKRFDKYYEQAMAVGKVLQEVKKECPEFKNVTLAFGTTSPKFHMAFLERGLPKEYLGSFAIDIAEFERMPERQPRAVEQSQLLYLYDFRKEFKCEDIPVYGTEEMYHPGCPGSLSQREQADCYVRGHLLGFALGVKRYAAAGEVFCTAGPYGRSHYGACGHFEVAPSGGGDGNPRESAVAYAVMTRVLDGADYVRHFPTGSFSSFCLGFNRKFGQSDVLALWTIHGKREFSIHADKDIQVTVTDQMGNSRPIESKDKIVKLEAGSSPIWVEGISIKQVQKVELGRPLYSDAPAQGYAILDEFDSPWSAEEKEDTGYQENNFDLPRFKAEMTGALVESFDTGKAFQITLKKPEKERKLAPWYTFFAPSKPILLPGKPTKIGLYVKGNSGWGRVIPQLTDAKGEIFTFIGPKDEWNSDDIRSHSSVNFDGWKYIEMELPNNLPNGFPGPALAFWKSEKGDRMVDYPLTLTKLAIEQRTHVYYVNEIIQVPDPAITIDKVLCVYDDPYKDWHLMKNW